MLSEVGLCSLSCFPAASEWVCFEGVDWVGMHGLLHRQDTLLVCSKSTVQP